MNLLLIGYSNINGFLNGGFTSWKEKNLPYDCVKIISQLEFIKFTQ